MHAPSKSSGPSAFQAFVPIAQRGIPFITMGAQTLGCHTSGGVRMIDPFASQNLPPTPQPQAEKGLTHPREIHSTLGFCVTTPPAPAAFLGSLTLPTSPFPPNVSDTIGSTPLIDTVPDILARIVAKKRQDLARTAQPLEAWEREAALRLPARRDFRAALAARPPAIIAEIKKASPRVRRMAAMPGQRSIILVSCGFVTLPEHASDKTDIMDRAIRANVLINALDARGLYTDTPDITRPGTNYQTDMVLQRMERETNRAQSDVMAELAAGTGATLFQNNNDLDAGFARLVSAPEYYYLLAFSPQNLKMDGSFHALKVTLKSIKDVNVGARTGYYAPRHLENAIETAKREIEEALFSREEMSDIPVELHTQFFKSGADTARVSAVIKVDVKHLKFRKEADRNCNELTVVAALFDRNGVYAAGNQKRIEMRLKDETVEKRLDGGITIRSSIDVKPGTYSIRLVVRDFEGQLMSAQNGAVDIPY